MPRRLLGTDRFTGLASRPAPHTIADSQLQEANNTSFSEIHALSSANDHLRIYQRSGTPRGYGIVRLNDADHHIFKVDTSIYDNNALVLNTGNTDTLRMTMYQDQAFLLGTTESYVWDGTYYRLHNPLTSTEDLTYNYPYVKIYEQINPMPISLATHAAPCVITTTTDPHGLVTGEIVYIADVTDMTELNGRLFTITYVGTNQFSLDGTDATNWNGGADGSTGNVYEDASGLEGLYRWRVTYRITMSNGVIIESEPQDVNLSGYGSDATEFQMSGTQIAAFYIKQISAAELAAYTNDSGATVEARLWRTKANGAEYWLTKTIEHANIIGSTYAACYDQTMDSELAVAWIDDDNTHGDPPRSNIFEVVKQRLFLADGTALHFSKALNFDYFATLGYQLFPETITALGRWSDAVIVFSAGRMWRYTPIDELGHIEDIPCEGGTTDPDSVVETPYGLLFANNRGLWLYDGNTPREISEEIYDLWTAEAGAWRGIFGDATAYYAQGASASEAAYALKRIGDTWQWSTETLSSAGSLAFMAASSDGQNIYAQTAGGIYRLHGGSQSTLSALSKKYGGLYKAQSGDMHGIGTCYNVHIDADTEGNDAAVIIHTSHNVIKSYTLNTVGQHITTYKMPPEIKGTYFWLEISLKGTLYGYWLDVGI